MKGGNVSRYTNRELLFLRVNESNQARNRQVGDSFPVGLFNCLDVDCPIMPWDIKGFVSLTEFEYMDKKFLL